MFDHIGFNVKNFQDSKTFYIKALAPLGIIVLQEGDGWALIGKSDQKLWFGSFGPAPEHIHLAFVAENREQVDSFYQAALASGGLDNGAPGVREQYHPNYYAAFILDPNGHNIEAVCHKAD
jgi:catechol 2,3-dioxygenase-like lactoylglutathione lyase family enzyme